MYSMSYANPKPLVNPSVLKNYNKRNLKKILSNNKSRHTINKSPEGTRKEEDLVDLIRTQNSVQLRSFSRDSTRMQVHKQTANKAI